MRNFSDNIVEKIKILFMSNKLFFSENRVFYEIMWKNMEERDKAKGDKMRHVFCMLHF